MYAVGILNTGRFGSMVPCGNNGLQKLRNKTRRGWMSETTVMRKCVDEVYVVSNFTQEMCEMSPTHLADYVVNHSISRLK